MADTIDKSNIKYETLHFTAPREGRDPFTLDLEVRKPSPDVQGALALGMSQTDKHVEIASLIMMRFISAHLSWDSYTNLFSALVDPDSGIGLEALGLVTEQLMGFANQQNELEDS